MAMASPRGRAPWTEPSKALEFFTMPASEFPQRRKISVSVFRLGEEPGDDLSQTTTAEERLRMLHELSARMWELTGRPMPAYERANIPIRVLRRP
jgi:hypothetical protein